VPAAVDQAKAIPDDAVDVGHGGILSGDAFNWVNFNPGVTIGDERDDFEVNGLTGNPRIIQLVSRISW
jgi:hypothetical protein